MAIPSKSLGWPRYAWAFLTYPWALFPSLVVPPHGSPCPDAQEDRGEQAQQQPGRPQAPTGLLGHLLGAVLPSVAPLWRGLTECSGRARLIAERAALSQRCPASPQMTPWPDDLVAGMGRLAASLTPARTLAGVQNKRARRERVPVRDGPGNCREVLIDACPIHAAAHAAAFLQPGHHVSIRAGTMSSLPPVHCPLRGTCSPVVRAPLRGTGSPD